MLGQRKRVIRREDTANEFARVSHRSGVRDSRAGRSPPEPEPQYAEPGSGSFTLSKGQAGGATGALVGTVSADEAMPA
jgi:hypothetical protein